MMTYQMPSQPGSAPFPTRPYPVAPPPRRNPVIVALGIALVLLAGGCATVTALYVIESGDHRETSANLDNTRRQLSDANNARQDVQDKLDESDRKLKDAEQSRDDAQSQVTELTKCRDAARALIDA